MQVMPPVKELMTAPSQAGLPSTSTISQKENLFRQVLSEVNEQQHEADAQVRRSLLGEGDLHEAMLALEKANLSLRVLVQVRNKMVQAYEELSRMPM